MSEQHQIIYGDSTIDFTLIRRARKTLEISVFPDLKVKTIAPIDADISIIKQKIVKRAKWITRQIEFFQQFHPKSPLRCYLSGESHLFLGKNYRLKVIENLQKQVQLSQHQLTVYTHSPDRPDITQQIIEQWYFEQAKVILNERVTQCLTTFTPLKKFKPDSIIIRQLNNRWGSMTKIGNLILNRQLVKAPLSSIDYVITHELCHRQHPDHGNKFYELLSQVMPNWEKYKTQLEHLLS
jgi:predicted metal-dependent hydrolase